MSLVPIKDLMVDARKRKYAVGYFEGWDLETTLAVCVAAEKMNSPVIIGFSGIYLPKEEKVYKSTLKVFADIATNVAKNSKVPVSTIYNESPDLESVLECIEYGYGIVMFSDEHLSFVEQTEKVKLVVEKAHKFHVEVEGEVQAIFCQTADNTSKVEAVKDLRITDIKSAENFIEKTGIDLFAVNLGQAHMHGRVKSHIDLDKLKELRQVIDLPLVLHGASSVDENDLVQAIKLGVSKINIGSIMKKAYLNELRNACNEIGKNYDPYVLVGSGLNSDVLTRASIAVQSVVEKYILLFGSSGKV